MYHYLLMHSECTILMQIPQNFQKRPPAGGNYPFPPFGASRLSLRSCWALVSPGNGGSGSAPGVQCYLLRSIKLDFFFQIAHIFMSFILMHSGSYSDDIELHIQLGSTFYWFNQYFYLGRHEHTQVLVSYHKIRGIPLRYTSKHGY